MQSDSFEKAFSEFLESKTCDDAEGAVFAAMRAAFLAGWKAAGGDCAVPPDNMIYLLHKSD